MEAEYIALATAIQNAQYIRTIVNSANIPGVRYEHAIKYHHVCDCVNDGCVVTETVRSEDNCSDVMTKPLGKNLFGRHSPRLMGWTVITPIDKKIRPLGRAGWPALDAQSHSMSELMCHRRTEC
jgi:hypothetical protein